MAVPTSDIRLSPLTLHQVNPTQSAAFRRDCNDVENVKQERDFIEGFQQQCHQNASVDSHPVNLTQRVLENQEAAGSRILGRSERRSTETEEWNTNLMSPCFISSSIFYSQNIHVWKGLLKNAFWEEKESSTRVPSMKNPVCVQVNKAQIGILGVTFMWSFLGLILFGTQRAFTGTRTILRVPFLSSSNASWSHAMEWY